MERLLIRVDLNITPEHARSHARFHETVDAVRKGLREARQIILLSHYGRPGGKRMKAYSLKPFQSLLAHALRMPVGFLTDPFKPSLKQQMRERVILVENLRFWPGEEENQEGFAEALAELGEAYVLDAFSILHRAHASIVTLPRLLPSRLGWHAEREVRAISRVFHPRKPFITLLGGAKLSTKLPVIQKLLEEDATILLGGAMFFTFHAAIGRRVGTNPVESSFIPVAKRLLRAYGDRLLLPTDGVTRDGRIISLDEDYTEPVWDIGPATRTAWKAYVRGARMIIWNGPLGRVESSLHREGTRELARAFPSKWRAYTLVGGGDTLEALRLVNIPPRRFSHATPAGGAFLHYLAQHTLPGLEALGWKT